MCDRRADVIESELSGSTEADDSGERLGDDEYRSAWASGAYWVLGWMRRRGFQVKEVPGPEGCHS